MPIYEVDGVQPTLPAAGRYWVAPDADVIGKVTLGDEAAIWFGAVLRGDIEPISIGARSNVQDLTLVHTDAGQPMTVGEGCTIGHRAILHGCTIGSNTLIGMGAVILTGARIGSNCLIGAHALVTEGKEIPDGSLVVGVPGRVLRPLTEAEIAANRASADRYVRRWRGYANGSFKKLAD
jgi:carbonic anhydrase/acetyltransferase-like protein (isoleucine patch superfamily)